MTRNALLVTSLVAVALVAGCVETNAPDADAPQAPTDPVSQEVGSAVLVEAFSPQNTTLGRDTPFLLPASAGPDTPLTAFRWRIPDGAIQTITPIPEIPDFNYDMIILEMVPVTPGNVSIDSFAVLAVNLEDEAYLTSSYIAVPLNQTSSTTLVDEQNFDHVPELASLFLRIYADDLQAGDELGFILAGHAAAAAPFGFLAAPRVDNPDFDDEPAATPAELLEGRTAVTLEPVGSGAGMQVALYLNLNLVFATAVFNIEVTTPSIQVADTTRTPTEPVATARQSILTAAYPDAGHTEAAAYYFAFALLAPNCVALGTYDIQMDIHGTVIDHRNLIAENPAPVGAQSLVTGSPIAFVIAEGPGGASTSFDIDVASSCSYEVLQVQQVDLGATLQELFGVPALTGGAAFSGIGGNLPPVRMWAEGDELVLLTGHQMQRLPGLGHVLEPVAAS